MLPSCLALVSALVLVAIEASIARGLRLRLYDLRDTAINLAMALGGLAMSAVGLTISVAISMALWAAHEAHHSSLRYNLSTALRLSWTTPLTGLPFWWVLPLLGFHPTWIVIVHGVSLAYQFLLHTQLIGKLGPLEWVLNTPSHHRVHHGCDPEYLDKNFGGIFILWDRMFGTFAEERHEPTYGLVGAKRSGPLDVAFGAWRDLWIRSRRVP
jgi:alkylglycerol monooxygenase